jgi:hypothetical protein
MNKWTHSKTYKFNIMLPVVVGVGCYLASTAAISWTVFWFVLLSHCSLDVTYKKKG